MTSRISRIIGVSLAFIILAALCTASAQAKTQPVADAPRARAAAPLAASVPVHLCASAGTVTVPDAVDPIPIWGFSPWNGSSCEPAQLPGPTIIMNEGDSVTIVLHNQLAENVSIIFPGQALFPDSVGAGSGGTTSYSFTASAPGTYLYESGANAERQVPMGLYGALIVRSATSGQAYDDVDGHTAYNVEQVLVLSEIDPAFNAAPAAFNMLNYAPKYWLINGKAYPQTNTITASAGQRVLLRYVNAGLMNHTMTLLGAHQRVIATDAFLQPYPFDVVAQTLPSGQTADMIATVPAGSASGSKLWLYNRQLNLHNAGAFPGGMMTNIAVP